MSNPKLGEPFPAVKEMIQTHLKEYIPSNALWGPEDPLTGLPTYMRKTETVSSYLAGRVLSFNRINNSLNHLAEGNIELCSIMTNRFLNDIARHKIELLCRELATSYDKRYAVPSDWNPTLPAHASVPLPDSVVPSKEFLDWVDIHVGSGTRKGLFETNEAGRGKRSVTVSRDDLIKLWKDNGGSICRVFGIEGSWRPGHEKLLSIDKIDPTRGYESGNLMIMLWRMNDAKCQFGWRDVLEWRDGLVNKWQN